MAVAESYPELKANENYIKTMDSVNEYEKMVRQSRLIYNDSVTKLNRTTRSSQLQSQRHASDYKPRLLRGK